MKCEFKGREGNSDFWCVEGSGIFQIIYGEGQSLPFLFESPLIDVFETGQLRAAQLTEATAGAREVAGFLPAANKGVNTLKEPPNPPSPSTLQKKVPGISWWKWSWSSSPLKGRRGGFIVLTGSCLWILV